jgi:hypothetical protein
MFQSTNKTEMVRTEKLSNSIFIATLIPLQVIIQILENMEMHKAYDHIDKLISQFNMVYEDTFLPINKVQV